jgi:hypothetical protein
MRICPVRAYTALLQGGLLNGRRAARFTTIRGCVGLATISSPGQRRRATSSCGTCNGRDEVQRLQGASDLHGALAARAERLKAEGWTIEGAIDHGFTFLNLSGERRLLALTERDPADAKRQTYSPFR